MVEHQWKIVEMKPLKLCEDCKWFVPYRPIAGDSGHCKSPNNPTWIRPTDGKPEVVINHAIVHRRSNWLESLLTRTCGRRARWFEKK